MLGKAHHYDIRYSTSLITEDNWSSATQCEGEPIPKEAGNTEAFIVTGLTPATDYWFGIKAIDEAGEESPLSTIVHDKTTCVIMYPNPLIRSQHPPKVTFKGSGIPHSTIKIYTLAGELVKTIKEEEGNVTVDWDLTNNDGKEVASGIYIYLSVNSVETNRGKIGIIK